MTQDDRLKRYTRKKKRVMVRFGLEQADKTAFTMNLSLDGAFIRTNSVYRPGTVLLLEVPFPQKTFLLRGRVIWAKKVPMELQHILQCGMGVRLIEPSEEWQAFFAEWSQKA